MKPDLTPLPSGDITSLKLTPEEMNLYQHHVNNFRRGKMVFNPNGTASTVLQRTVEVDGKYYSIPSVWDGKILPEDQIMQRVRQEGLKRFPSYPTEEAAQARYDQMHKFMEKDVTDINFYNEQ